MENSMIDKENTFDQEVHDIDKMIDKDKTNIDLWIKKGIIYKKRKLYDEAIEAYSMGLTYDPFNNELYRIRGISNIPIKKFGQAASNLELAARINPEDWSSIYHLGLSYYLLKDYERAYKIYQKCYEITDPNDCNAYAIADWMWLTLNKLGNPGKAEMFLKNIDENIDAGENELYRKRILLYKKILGPEELLEICNSKDELFNISCMYGVAMYYLYNGQEKKSNELLKEILKHKECFNAFAYTAASVEDDIQLV